MIKLLRLILIVFFTHLGALSVEEVLIIPYKENIQERPKETIAISTIFKSEASYLEEWIEYHRLIGVAHFYLYNNCSDDNYLEVLGPYIQDGIVELFDVPYDSSQAHDGAATHNLLQVCCYNHALNLAKGKNKWLAIIDSDEFICPMKTKSLKKCLKAFDYASSVVVYWQIYGTSNVWELNPGELLIEKLLYRAPSEYGENRLFKSIVKPEFAICQDPHWSRVTEGLQVTPDHVPFSHTRNFKHLPVSTLRINHYTFRTESFYHHVKMPRRASWGHVPTPEANQERIDVANKIYDPTMNRFVLKLKEQIKRAD